MDNAVFNMLVDFVEEYMYKYDFLLTRATDIKNDLKIRGDDAVEFIIAYAKKFNVYISHFNADDYIEDEGVNLIFNANKKRLTLGSLEMAIISGRLDEEIIQSNSL